MEEEKGSSSSSASLRWNPTKEQIAILEGLYRKGIRTPSAEQIQQVTGKLREYGSIEGKNVFYWFQNHKARQRQKQKQASFTYFSRLLHHQVPPPVLSPPPPPLLQQPCTNVFYSTIRLPVPQVGGAVFYQAQVPNVFLPGAAERRPMPEIQKRTLEAHNNMPSPYGPICHETLQLFPLHPTGILDERSGSSVTSASAETESIEEEEEEEGGENLPFFNFLGAPKE